MSHISLPGSISDRLRLPLIAAPMFLVSGPDLVIAASRAGVIGSFPTANCRRLEELDDWLARITQATLGIAPYAPNLIVHRSNQRLQNDVGLVAKHRAPLVIASVGSPAPILDKIHAYGGLAFADIASMRHAERAITAGADGLILLGAGAGGPRPQRFAGPRHDQRVGRHKSRQATKTLEGYLVRRAFRRRRSRYPRCGGIDRPAGRGVWNR